MTDDEVTYAGMHHRLRMARGKAGGHQCSNCSEQAAHWAYDNGDPEERIENDLRFSVKPEHYTPLCASCHKRFDNEERELRAT